MKKTNYSEEYLGEWVNKNEGRSTISEKIVFFYSTGFIFLLVFSEKFLGISDLKYLILLVLSVPFGYFISRLMVENNNLKSQIILGQIISNKKLIEMENKLENISNPSRN